MLRGLRQSRWGWFALVAVLGCGSKEAPPTTGASPAKESTVRLASEPAGAQEVGKARAEAKDGESICIVGRIGGSEKPFVDGMAAFMIVDSALKPCVDDCPTPWDYCCDLDRLPTNKAMVKFVNDKGAPLATDARELLGVKELATVVVTGRVKKDSEGNLTVLADGAFVRP